MLNYEYEFENPLIISLFCLIIVFLGSSYKVKSQDLTQTNTRVVYQFSHVEDTTQIEKPLIEEYFLYFNDQNSLFIRYNEEDGQISRFVQGGGSMSKFNYERILPDVAAIYRSFPQNKLVDTKRIITEMYQIQEELPEINWEIQEEIKDIQGFKVQKATTEFRGRVYEVWFAADIPVSFGPWKLHGLPGLILEAKDLKNQVIFTFKSIETVENPVKLDFFPKIRQISYKDYALVYKAFRDNPAAFARNIAPNGMTVVTGGSTASRSRSSSTRPIQYNNPIELNFPL